MLPNKDRPKPEEHLANMRQQVTVNDILIQLWIEILRFVYKKEFVHEYGLFSCYPRGDRFDSRSTEQVERARLQDSYMPHESFTSLRLYGFYFLFC
jgi:hypothetical protein